MEKRPRKNKSLKVNIDTPIVDVTYTRDENGVVDALVDTPLVDAVYHKDADGKKTLNIIHDHKTYDFEGNGTHPELPKGSCWKITGDMVKIFLRDKLGNLKKK